MIDIKSALYALLGRKKMGIPNYDYSPRSDDGFFSCSLALPGFNYVGRGFATSKKEAATCAAKDFALFLIRTNVFHPSELPESTQAVKGKYGNEIDAPSESTSASVCQNFPVPSVSQKIPVLVNSHSRPLPCDASSVPLKPCNPKPSTSSMCALVACNETPNPIEVVRNNGHRVESPAAVTVSMSEPQPTTSHEDSFANGGHNMDNAKRTLNEYFQLKRIKNVDYNTHSVGTALKPRFLAELKIYLNDLRREVYVRGESSTKKVAENMCAFQIVRELYSGGKIPEYSEGKKIRPSFDELADITIKVNDISVQRALYIASHCGVIPVDASSAMPFSPISLIPAVSIETFANVHRLPRQQSVPCSAPADGFHTWRSRPLRAEEDFYGKTLIEISDMLRARDHAKSIPQHIQNIRERLPVFGFREQIVQAVDRNCLVLIKGSTGNGKSTQIVQYLLEDHIKNGLGAAFNAIVSQPRRISALTLAERVAFERGESIGDSVGYSIRFDAKFPRPFGSIAFVTVGVLLRMMETGLNGISHIIVDEIHERDVKTDFLLILLREVVRTYPHMRLILMSATFDVDLLRGYFGDFPAIEMNVRTHPVEHFFLEDVIQKLNYYPLPRKRNGEDDDGDLHGDAGEQPLIAPEMKDMYNESTKLALSKMRERDIPFDLIQQLLLDIHEKDLPGAVLIFLPGWSDIMSLLKTLQRNPILGNSEKFLLLPLHSLLTSAEQHKVFERVPAGVRKIILSTNIAESSVTIDDIVFVIDSCKVKEKVYTAQNNIVHFATVWAAKSNLIQRRGRAGRVRAGYCYHLCTRSRFSSLEEHRTAEILRTPLHELALTVKLLRLGSIREVLGSALEPPPRQAIIEAENLLREINALDRTFELTPLGRILAKLPIDPLVGKALVLASALGIGDLMCTVAAASGFNSPFAMRESHTYPQLSFAGKRNSDHVAVLTAFNKYVEMLEFGEASVYRFCRDFGLAPTTLKMISEARKQIRDTLVGEIGFPNDCYTSCALDNQGDDPNLNLMTSLLISAHYPNLCVHRDKRRVYTLEKMNGVMSSSSVNARQKGFRYPFFVFTEKLKTRIVTCVQMSMVSPVQLLLFGCRKIEAKSDSLVVLDDVITLRMNVVHAAAIVALRPCIESYLMRVSLNPQFLVQQTASDNDLRLIVKELSSFNACTVQPKGTPVVPSYEQLARQFYDGYGYGAPLSSEPSSNNVVAVSAQVWAAYASENVEDGVPTLKAYADSAPTYDVFAKQVESRKRRAAEEASVDGIALPPSPRRSKT
ncbi:hypothetical protein QR680_017348 [Steinernema hermaphroditum]|uniref:RNA helicase n=1 Tax=Steinernema hermaphroditum TaxID=289476 RepID=A0AA39LNU8_9BILA|nr:hypothetical protein QR680_017348 [Steinernema hermaphroditum]